MGYSRDKLTARAVSSFTAGQYGDGGGLLLRKTSKDAGSWIFRFRLYGRARQMGLGSFQKVSLRKARDLRDTYEKLVADGVDPVEYRRKEHAVRLAEEVTLEEVAQKKLEAHKETLKKGGKAGRWFSPLELHILPSLGARKISDIDQNDVAKALEPIWRAKAPTAVKAAQRLNSVLLHAAALGLDVDVQAVVKAKALLGPQQHKTKNLPSMRWQEVPAFYNSLDEERLSHLALKFIILNPGPRSQPVRHIHLNEIEGDVWTIPEGGMKGQLGKAEKFRTPLSEQSQALIDQLKPSSVDGYLFPNKSRKGVISDSTTSKVMREMGLEAVPHGFRSSFRTWAADTNRSRTIVELCLAHTVHGRVEASYIRTDYLEQRRAMMQEWSDYVTSSIKLV